MYKQDSYRQLLTDYKITVTDRKMQRHRRMGSYLNWHASSLDPFNQIEEEIVPVLNVEIQEAEFMRMAETLCEFNDLMRDPETARLLMEARFINRLKGR
jgi:hypothetical protein